MVNTTGAGIKNMASIMNTTAVDYVATMVTNCKVSITADSVSADLTDLMSICGSHGSCKSVDCSTIAMMMINFSTCATWGDDNSLDN